MTQLANRSDLKRSCSDILPMFTGHWVECVSHVDPRFGGISAVIPQLGSRLASDHGFRIDIAGFSKQDETDALVQYPSLQGSHWTSSRAAWLCNRELERGFYQAYEASDGFHIHGLWETHATVAAQAARRWKKPYIVSAHGMLEPWALAQGGLKKRIYSALVERANLKHAACLHALTVAEADDYRRFGCRNPIAVIPNAVEALQGIHAAPFLNAFPELKDRSVVLFLGRLHPKKGLELLIRAWATVESRFPNATLVLAGPDEANYRLELEALVREQSLTSRTLFTGMLGAALKWSALASAICFVLPSYSEGFSMAVLEALAIGLPVIVTKQCHISEITAAHAGWEIQPTIQELSGALQKLLRNDLAENREIGERGRHLVQERFSWNVVANQMAELYSWVQSGSRPQSFDLLEVTP